MNYENDPKIIRIHEDREVYPHFPQEFRMLADGMLKMGAIRFGDFKWTLHKNHPDAPPGPMYFELRAVRGDPALRKYPVTILSDQILDIEFGVLADVPTSITPTVAIIAEEHRVPMGSPRKEAKDRGTGVLVDGFNIVLHGKKALPIDDLLSGGHAMLDAVQKLKDVGLIVEDVAVLMDYEIGGREILEDEGYKVHRAFTAEQLLDYLYKSRQIDIELFDKTKNRFDEIRSYFKNIG